MGLAIALTHITPDWGLATALTHITPDWGLTIALTHITPDWGLAIALTHITPEKRLQPGSKWNQAINVLFRSQSRDQDEF